jgi:transcriptional regulator with XRE-family HTH domain
VGYLQRLSESLPQKRLSPLDAEVGGRIRVRRAFIGMSQEKLGELLGLSFQQVQKYEKGVNRIGAGRLWQAARILGVPITYFYEGLVDPDQEIAESDQVSAEVMRFVASREGMQLTLGFMRIKEPGVRKRVLDLTRSLAQGEDVPVS